MFPRNGEGGGKPHSVGSLPRTRFIDRANGGTLDGTIQTLGLLAGIGGPKILYIPGHGDVSRREVMAVKDRVAPLVRDGATLEEVLAARTTADYEEKWGDPVRFVTAVYEELGGGAPAN